MLLNIMLINTAISQEYCTPYFTGDNGPDKFTGITNVKLNSLPEINNSSDYNDWYVFFDNVETGSLKIDNEYELTIRVKWNIVSAFFSNKAQIYAWIDWNQNFLFEENEIVMEVLKTEFIEAGTEIDTTIQFIVPSNAVEGETRLRISEDMGITDGHLDVTSCGYPTDNGLGQHGNVEDYKIKVVSPNSVSSIQENSNHQISINPNIINSDNMLINIELMSNSNNIELYVIDLDGNIVLRINSKNLNLGHNNVNLNISYLSFGKYYLVSNYLGQNHLSPFIISK